LQLSTRRGKLLKELAHSSEGYPKARLIPKGWGGFSFFWQDLPSLVPFQHLRRLCDAFGARWSRAKAWFLGNNPKWEAEKRVPAVCIPPGALLVLRDIPKNLQRELGVGEIEEVQFVETTAEVNTYRDAVRFQNRRQALLQQLREGQRVKVLSIAIEEFEPAETALWSV
jgi:hypothetical protein